MTEGHELQQINKAYLTISTIISLCLCAGFLKESTLGFNSSLKTGMILGSIFILILSVHITYFKNKQNKSFKWIATISFLSIYAISLLNAKSR
ncbi:hypothetical protein [Cellulosilyticum ruminicola]|uniref:hypothetical protein n=1 Tax=Cellulosilyticum ruminicola TaxID=425254 RepID=UPI0006CFE1A7|nr:hypothetical protein [Cellulosilyticum ruminicola]